MPRSRTSKSDAKADALDSRAEDSSAYFVYMVRCADDTLYTGIATDVERRVAEHNMGTGARYTRTRRPVELLYVERCGSRGDALRREAAIKDMTRSAKMELAGGEERTAVTPGTLYLVATPIGNLEDITLRALNVLRQADLIAAEDTRHTGLLLKHFDISATLVSYHEHNRTARGGYLLERLRAGDSVALVSDAGTPGISDPGEDIVRAAREEGIRVVPVPGASALLSALTASGLPTQPFAFEGFPPARGKERRAFFDALAREQRTVAIYEAPHRLAATLREIGERTPSRKIVIARELTKRFEEFLAGTASELLNHFEEHRPRGEFVLVLEPLPPEEKAPRKVAVGETGVEGVIAGAPAADGAGGLAAAVAEVARLEAEGATRSRAVKEAARRCGVNRQDLYRAVEKTEAPR